MRTKDKSKLIHPDLSYEVVGICFAAHNELGRYSREKQYGDRIEKLLKEKGLNYERECEIADTGNRADFVIEDKIVLELKTRRRVTKRHYYQTQRYLQASGIKLGIIANFREEDLDPRRVIRLDNYRATH